MTNALTKYTNLKKKVEEAQQTADKAEGAMEQVMKQLDSEFGCSTLKQAKQKLKELEGQETKAKRVFEKAVEDFEDKWDEQVED